jgi:hypothetical protein
VAQRAKGDKAFFGIVTRLIAKLFVMDFQTHHRAAGLGGYAAMAA